METSDDVFRKTLEGCPVWIFCRAFGRYFAAYSDRLSRHTPIQDKDPTFGKGAHYEASRDRCGTRAVDLRFILWDF